MLKGSDFMQYKSNIRDTGSLTASAETEQDILVWKSLCVKKKVTNGLGINRAGVWISIRKSTKNTWKIHSGIEGFGNLALLFVLNFFLNSNLDFFFFLNHFFCLFLFYFFCCSFFLNTSQFIEQRHNCLALAGGLWGPPKGFESHMGISEGFWGHLSRSSSVSCFVT